MNEAIEFRAVLLHELRQGKVPGREPRGPALTWDEFRTRYQEEHLIELSAGSWGNWRAAANHCERVLRPKYVTDLDKSAFSKFQSELAKAGLEAESIRSYVRSLRAALGWALSIDLLTEVPRVRFAKGVRKSASMQGRPVNQEEFERILMTIAKVRPHDPERWEFFLKGLRLSSLRIGEGTALSWDQDAYLSIDTSGRVPLIRMYGEGHKSRRDLYLPMSKAFWDHVNRIGDRSGPVLPMLNRRGEQMTSGFIGRVISKFGAAAGVIVNHRRSKTASSHDICRRTFLTDLASRHSTSKVAQWARHQSTQTTSDFYIRHDAEALAAEEGW